jgi:GNAT superfamily N-acetyltransferase
MNPVIMQYQVELAKPLHLAILPAIEHAAAELFSIEDLPPALRTHSTPLGRLQQAQQHGRLWVALAEHDQPVGFALVTVPDKHAHLQELDVHPQHGRQGLGTKLVQTVLAGARQQSFACMTLTTFRHVAWNAPFYTKLGFTLLDEEQLHDHPALRHMLKIETRDGLRNRVAMRCML